MTKKYFYNNFRNSADWKKRNKTYERISDSSSSIILRNNSNNLLTMSKI